MTRHLSIFALTTVLIACQLGCQTPSMLFGKRDLADGETIAELKADADDEPSTQVADLVDRADRDFKAQRYDRARDTYERVLRDDPANSHAHHHLAVIADLQEQYRAAEEHYQAALVRDGRNSQILSSMAYSYILQGRFEDAETRLNQARVADPADRNAASNLALLYACRGDREKCQAIARTLGSADDAQTIVDDMFQRASELAPAQPKSDIQLAGAFDMFKKDRRQDPDAIYADGVNQETYELKQQMDAAKRAARIERQRRMSPTDPRRRIPPTQEILGARGVANYDLNDALAEIDRPQEPRKPVASDPRIRSVAPGSRARSANAPRSNAPSPNLPAWANPEPSRQQSAQPFGANGQYAQQADGRDYGVVNADLTQPRDSRSQPTQQAIVPTQGNGYPSAPPTWPTELDHSRQPPAQPTGVGTYPGQSAPQQPGYNGSQNNLNQPPSNFNPSNSPSQPGYQSPNQQQPIGSQSAQGGQPGQTSARQRAASLGMGTGLGGMFDRYAYKAGPNVMNPRQTLAPQGDTVLPQEPEPFGPPNSAGMNAGQPNAMNAPGVPANAQSSQFNSQSYGTTPQQWPGTNSRLGATYPGVQRQLPTDRPAAPPTITAGMPAAPNWQGQTLPSSGTYLSGPANYGTTLPSGSAAPTPPASSFGAPVTNVQKLPTAADVRNGLNSGFNNLQRQMMGSPNLVPTNAYGQSQAAAARQSAAAGRQLPTQTGPTNSNVPYYNQNTGPTSGGFQNTDRVGLPRRSPMPSGFVDPPPYRGGANRQPPAGSTSPNGFSTQTPYSQQRSGSLPQITPGGQQ